jgi:hypothetical protein
VTLVEAIQKDLRLLDKTVDSIKTASTEPGINRAPALTQYLSQFYTGFESCLEKTLKVAKIAPPTKSDSHHRKLLDLAVASKLVPGTCVEFLYDLMAFRHVTRHGYGKEWRGDEIMEKAVLAERFWPELNGSIKSFLPQPPDAGLLKDAVAVNQAQGEIKASVAKPPVSHTEKSKLEGDSALQAQPPKDPNLP